MKWKNEYIISALCANRQFIICMTIIVSEDANAQTILHSMNNMVIQHISQQLQQQINITQFNYQFITMVKQKLITEEEANDLEKQNVRETLRG